MLQEHKNFTNIKSFHEYTQSYKKHTIYSHFTDEEIEAEEIEMIKLINDRALFKCRQVSSRLCGLIHDAILTKYSS